MANKKSLVNFKEGHDERRNTKGRPVGSLNRSTVARRWLETMEKYTNPLTDEVGELSQEDIITLEQIKEARYGKNKTQAYAALMDSAHGRAVSNVKLEGDSNINIQYINPYNPKDDPDNK